ncbi:uncharacterized protein LOC143082281 [Mytilus galloprovincialis]|uniref:uncharacterized protein LOC143082281 n=1 Tax=Mytilus galloprovincialis TaxID=29158 RepID=UPI003F7BACC5
MATRRSRIHVKPNIGGKTFSGLKRGQTNEEKGTSVQISAELAAGAATAVGLKKGISPTKDLGWSTEVPRNSSGKVGIVVSSPSIRGDNKGNTNQQENKNSAHKTSSGVTKPAFTRLKTLGLNVGSREILHRSESKEEENDSSDENNDVRPKIVEQNKEKSPSSKRSQSSVLNKPGTFTKRFNSNVPKPKTQLPCSSPVDKISPNKSLILSPHTETSVEDKNVEKKIVDSHEPEKNVENVNNQIQDGSESSPKPSVIQRLPFRSRFPKAKPNIEALKLRNKNINLSGSKEDISTRPSSPLKSPRLGKILPPLKFINHHAQKPVSPVEVDKSQDTSPEINVHTDGATEARKRHYSNSSISTVHSDTQGLLKNNKQKNGYTDEDAPINKNTMTMGDLIYWNPGKNQMTTIIETPKKKAKVIVEKENVNIEEEEKPQESEEADMTDSKDPDMPVPQVKIGPDGSIIINEESLIIKKKDESPVAELIEETGSTATYNSFRKPLSRIAWSEWETEKFYRALSYIGTDFSLMVKLFKRRTRYDIKTKFKREDKLNRNKVELALKNKKPFDMSFFAKEEKLEAIETERKKKEDEEKLKKTKEMRQEKKREKNAQKEKHKEKEEKPTARKSTRPRKNIYYDYEDATEGDVSEIESTPPTPVKTPIRIPFKRYENAPFVPPFCLSQDEDDDSDIMELQVTMSDSEILSPQKQTRSEVSSQMERSVNINPATFASKINSEMEGSIAINPAEFPPNANVQITHDANNSPLVLVYHTPEDGKGETVIHVYQLQNQPIGNLQIPLDGASNIVELPSNLQSAAGTSSANGKSFCIQAQTDEPMEELESGDNLPFIIATGEDNPQSLLLPQGMNREPSSDHDNEDYINIIDINASKISTPGKNLESKEHDVSDNSMYQVVTVNQDTDLDNDDSRSSPSVSIDNEFVASDVDQKYIEHEDKETRKGKR